MAPASSCSASGRKSRLNENGGRDESKPPLGYVLRLKRHFLALQTMKGKTCVEKTLAFCHSVHSVGFLLLALAREPSRRARRNHVRSSNPFKLRGAVQIGP